MVIMSQIGELARGIGRESRADRALLLGFRARGVAAEDYDVDLLVVEQVFLPPAVHNQVVLLQGEGRAGSEPAAL